MALKLAVKSVNITPPARVSLAGQFRLRVSEGVESPVLANIFMAESDGEQLVIVSCELVSICNEFMEDLRGKLSKKCPEINCDKIIVSSTHTHTGPDTAPKRHVGGVDPKYAPDGIHIILNEEIPEDMWGGDKCREWITDILSDAMAEAWESRAEGYYGAAFGRAVTGHNRRACYNDGTSRLFGTTQTGNFSYLESGSDTGIELLYIFDKHKKPIGALANVACPAQCVEDMKVVSADYWSKARDYVKKEFGEDFVLVGLLSAAGDLCPVDLVRRYRGKNQYWRRSDTFNMENHFEGAAELGKRVGREVVERISECELKCEAVIKNEAVVLDYPIRRVTNTEYDAHLKHVREKIAEFGTNALTPGQGSDIFIDIGAIKRYLRQEETPTVPGEVHIARFDDIAFATNTFELFLDYGNRIRGASPAAQTFLIQLSNGATGYLPTARAIAGSHYSAYVSSGVTGQDGGDLLVAKTLCVLNSLFHDVEKT